MAWRGDGLCTISSEQLVLAVFWGEGHIEIDMLLRCIKKPPALALQHEMMLSWSLRSALESCYSKVDVNFCNPASRHLPFSADFPCSSQQQEHVCCVYLLQASGVAASSVGCITCQWLPSA